MNEKEKVESEVKVEKRESDKEDKLTKMPSQKILKRIAAESGIHDILKILTKMSPTDLQSLLLEVYKQKALSLQPRQIVKQYRENRFTEPSTMNQLDLINFDSIAYQVLPKTYEAIELSPIAPFGLNSVLTKISQNNVMTTSRNVEIVADPTSILAIICAHKRDALLKINPKTTEKVRLATSHRIIRQQNFDNIDGFTPHFRAFALTSAGRDTGNEQFEKELIVEHISFYLTLIKQLSSTNLYYADDITVAISDIRIIETLVDIFAIDRVEIGQNTQNLSYSVFKKHNIALPDRIHSIQNMPKNAIIRYGIERPIELLDIAEKTIIAPLRKAFPRVSFVMDIQRTAGIGYYATLCFKISMRNQSGNFFPLVDGGMVDWTQKLLSSRKERVLTSGIGSELFCKLFRKKTGDIYHKK